MYAFIQVLRLHLVKASSHPYTHVFIWYVLLFQSDKFMIYSQKKSLFILENYRTGFP
jgi:hypothetical protein